MRFSKRIALSLVALAAAFACFLVPGASAELVRTDSWGGDLKTFPFVPSASVFDSQGRAFVADSGMARIIRVETDDSIDFNWSVGQPSGDWKKQVPVDMTIDDADNIYILDQMAREVRKYSTEGALLDSWPVAMSWLENEVRAIAWEAGSVWVITDTVVRRYSPDGDVLGGWGGFETTAEWVTPLIEGDGNGHLLITGGVLKGFKATKTIYTYEPDGTLVSKWSTPAEVQIEQEGGSYQYWDVVTGVYGFDQITPAGDGTVWTSIINSIQRYGPGGAIGPVIDGPGWPTPSGIAVSPGGTLFYGRNDYWTGGSLISLDGSNQVRKEWSRSDFPKYASDRWEGQFNRAEDLAVRGDGAVGGYDPAWRRTQTFEADGTFLDLYEAPEFDQLVDSPVGLFLPDGGGADLFQKKEERLLRYDSNGDLFADVDFEVPGSMVDVTADPEGDYLTLSGNSGERAKVTFLAADGSTVAAFTTKSVPSIGYYAGSRIETDPAGHVYLLARDFIQKHTRSGDLLATWIAPKIKCGPEYSLHDVATDSTGNAYVLTVRGTIPYVMKFDSSLTLQWEEPVGEAIENGRPASYLDIGPDGSIYVDAGEGIGRFDQSAASAQPREYPCPPPTPADMKVLKVKYEPGRKAAKLKVRTFEAGRIWIMGPKTVTVVRKVKRKGDHQVRVRLQQRFVKQGRSRKLKETRVRVYFQSAQAPRRNNSVSITLKLRSR